MATVPVVFNSFPVKDSPWLWREESKNALSFFFDGLIGPVYHPWVPFSNYRRGSDAAEYVLAGCPFPGLGPETLISRKRSFPFSVHEQSAARALWVWAKNMNAIGDDLKINFAVNGWNSDPIVVPSVGAIYGGEGWQTINATQIAGPWTLNAGVEGWGHDSIEMSAGRIPPITSLQINMKNVTAVPTGNIHTRVAVTLLF